VIARWLAAPLLAAVLASCGAAERAPAERAGTEAIAAAARFVVVPLGTAGGLDESNLSSYLLAVPGDERSLALDAGTLYAGLRAAIARGSLPGGPDASHAAILAALKGRVRAVLLSHPHLDHVAGLLQNSPEDAPRSLYGSAMTLDALRDHVFNGRLWANFLDEGAAPRLGRYHLVRLASGDEVAVEGTPFFVRAFPLAHGGDGGSTAFLLRAGADHVLYLGDTGPDAVERSTRLAELWKHVAPLVRARSLRAIFLECSYPEERPDALLFSHLTPRWMRVELDALAAATGGTKPDALEGLTLVVTHIKPAATPDGDARATIARQLGPSYRGARFVFPRQGAALGL
jgi:3',5'-cyclic-nucleotide phosphodiesterase